MNANEWEKLVQEVERAHFANRVQNASREISGRDMHGRRRMAVVPNVLPRYMAKPPTFMQQWAAVPAFLKISLVLAIVVGGSNYLWQSYGAPSRLLAMGIISGDAAKAQSSAGYISGGLGYRGDSGNGNASSEFRGSIQSALEGRLCPVGLIESIYGKQKLDWLKIRSIIPPKDGKTLIVFAVLYARLDDETEKRWHDAGLFKNEGVVPTPFVRKITIVNRESLDCLLDWHVEGVLASSPPAPVK